MYFPATRVLTVLELLQSRQHISGPELAAHLEVDTRTVRRYITLLQDLGIPVEAERGRYGSYLVRQPPELRNALRELAQKATIMADRIEV